MKRIPLVAIWLGIALAGSLAAAPFWTSKPYTEWTEKEVEKILGNSPWVQSADIELDFSALRQGGQGPGGPRMVGPGGPGGIGGPGAGGPGAGGPGAGGMQPPSAYVMWQSATIIRKAMARAAALRQSPSAPDLEAQLATEPAHHILAVMGLRTGPAGMGMRRPEASGGEGGPPQLSPEQQEAIRERMQNQMQESAELIIDKDTLKPEKVETVVSGSERVILFYFPNDTSLSAKTKSVQFRAQMGPLKITTKFKAKDMVE